MAKCFEDTLRSLQILPDDSPKYVALSIIEVIEKPRPPRQANKASDQIRLKGLKEDWLEITIEPYEFKPHY